MFIHWEGADGTNDLDLSCIARAASFRIVDQVSRTNLSNEATDSRDLTSVAKGAREFFDFNLAKASR